MFEFKGDTIVGLAKNMKKTGWEIKVIRWPHDAQRSIYEGIERDAVDDG